MCKGVEGKIRPRNDRDKKIEEIKRLITHEESKMEKEGNRKGNKLRRWLIYIHICIYIYTQGVLASKHIVCTPLSFANRRFILFTTSSSSVTNVSFLIAQMIKS